MPNHLTRYCSFPYELPNHPAQDISPASTLYQFYICGSNRAYGYILPEVVDKMPWTADFEVTDHSSRKVILQAADTATANAAIAKVLEKAKAIESFAILKGWRNELYPIVGHDNALHMERSGSALFGILTLGVHMTGFVETEAGMKIWIPRRTRTKQTYGGMLDNMVAGGISAGEQPLECLVREAAEEASLEEGLVRKGARACGTVSYFHLRDERAGGEIGLCQPEIQYVYDLQLPEHVVPKPSDDEVEEFYLMSIEEVQQAVAKGEFKPNSALCMVDFLVRHGVITAENEPKYLELVSRMHRTLPFPL